MPTELKEVKTLNAFKSRIKNWWPHNCPCRQVSDICQILVLYKVANMLEVAEYCAYLIKV